MKKYPNLKIYVAGPNIIDTKSINSKIKLGNYGRFIIRKIKDYNLKNNIIFLGVLSEEEMYEKMIHSNVYVQTSSIENSSNALGEAMLVGMPCVASYVGGTPDLLIDKKEGLLYPFGDYGLLAYFISKIFDDNKLAIELGKNAQKHANTTYDKKTNLNQIIQIYKKIIGGGDNI